MISWNTSSQRRQNRNSIDPAANSLEKRTMLAGALVARLSANGTLTIDGDSASNNIRVAVSGATLQVTAGKQDMMNGGPFFFYPTASVKNITISGNGGDDNVVVTGVILPGYLTVKLGSGNDVASLANSRVGGRLTVNGDAGNDFANIFSTEVNGDTFVVDDLGDDEIRLSLVAHGKLNVLTGAGHDRLTTFGTSVDKAVVINTGSGADNVIMTASNFAESLNLATAEGADHVSADSNTFNGSLKINAGSEVDNVGLFGNQFNAAASLDGGLGVDMLRQDDINFFTVLPSMKNFERDTML